MTGNTTAKPPTRSGSNSQGSANSSVNSAYRRAFRLIGISILAVAAVLIYRGLHERLVLPACDSDTAKRTLSEVLKQMKLEPTRYAPIKTVSSSTDRVVCNAVMPLSGGGSVVADYTFYWQGNKANMRYSIHRVAVQSSSLTVPYAGQDILQ